MIYTNNFVVKTNGSIFDEFQQIICGLILQEQNQEVKVHFISSSEVQEEISEYFNMHINFIEVKEIASTKYFYNEAKQDILLENYSYSIEGYDYIIYEARNEFKKPDMCVMEYMKLKSLIHKRIFDNVHDYIFPQLCMLYDTEKLNVGLNYKKDALSKIYEKCEHSDVYHYIDFTNNSSIEKINVNKFHIESQLLLFIALSMCDFIIGDINNKLNYEASMRKKMMVHDVSKDVSSINIIPVQKIYDEICMFPNSQLLLKYI